MPKFDIQSGVKTVLTLIVFGFTLFPSASAAVLHECWLEIVLVRGARGIPTEFADFSDNALVRKLGLANIYGYRQGTIRLRAFYPVWVFDDSELVETLRKSYPHGFGIGPRGDYQGLSAWLKEWERAYQAVGGKLSARWERPVRSAKLSGRESFLRKLALNIALEFHEQAMQGGAPGTFTRNPFDLDWSLLGCYTEILGIFGSAEAFQTQYRDFVRHTYGTRTPPPGPLSPADAMRQAVLDFLGHKQPHPHRAADARQRSQGEHVSAAADAIAQNREVPPLAAMGSESTATENIAHSTLGLELYKTLDDTFGNLGIFVRMLNLELGRHGIEPIILPRRVSSWEEEWLIQVGVAQKQILARTDRQFTGFQAEDSSAADYLEPTSDLFVKARQASELAPEAFLKRLNTAIQERAN
ncbi:hypothetical protein K2X33_08270 [bacterium]|nr:hypothetical protein [bacterium]